MNTPQLVRCDRENATRFTARMALYCHVLFYCHLFGESTGRLRRTEKQSDATSKRPIFHPLPLGEGRGEGSASELKKQAESETIEFRYASEGVTERHLVRDIVGIARALLSLEDWLDGQASSWQQLSDPEYTALLRCWSSLFNPLIEAGTSSRRGNRAFEELRARLPCDAVLFSGVRIPRLANMGGAGRRPIAPWSSGRSTAFSSTTWN